MGKMKKLSDFPMDKLFELVAEQMEGVVVVDAEGRIVYVSQGWTNITGLKLEDVKGKSVKDITPETRYEKAIELKMPLASILIKINDRFGKEVKLVSSYTPLYENGELVGCVIVSTSKGMHSVETLTSQVEKLTDENRHYKHELIRLQTMAAACKHSGEGAEAAEGQVGEPAKEGETISFSIQDVREKAEYDAIVAALKAHNGNKTKAAGQLGITRAMLYRKLEKYGL